MEKHLNAASAAPPINVHAVISAAPLRRFQVLVILVSALVIILDGYDMLAIAFTAAPIAADLAIPIARFTPVFAAGAIGIVVGSFAVGPLADRYGRRRFLILATALFAVASFGPPLDPAYPHLIAYRLLSGVGLGAATPCAIAMTAEYAPGRYRALLNNLMFAGFPIGGFLVGLMATQLVPSLGWRPVYYLGGAIPLFLLPFIVAFLPESAVFLARNPANGPVLAEILKKLDPSLAMAAGQRFFSGDVDDESQGLGELFSGGRARGTILLWFVFFSNISVLLFINSWLPALMNLVGMPFGAASRAATLMMAGGVLGGAAFGLLIDAYGACRVLVLSFLLTAVLIAMLGHDNSHFLLTLLFLVGVGLVGCQLSINGLPARFYPTKMRSTGIGWALGMGNIGAIAGPVSGGAMMAAGWRPGSIYIAAACPLLLAAGCVFALSFFYPLFDRAAPRADRSTLIRVTNEAKTPS